MPRPIPSRRKCGAPAYVGHRRVGNSGRCPGIGGRGNAPLLLRLGLPRLLRLSVRLDLQWNGRFLETRIERKGFSQTLSEKPERRSKSPPFRAALQQHLYGCVFKQKQGRRRKACLSLRCMTCSKEKQRGGELCCRAGARNKTLVQRSAMCSKEKKESQRKARLSSHRRSRAVQAGAAQLLMGSGAGGGTAQQHDGWGRLLAGPFLYPVAASCCCAVSRRQVGLQAVFNKRRNVGGVRLPQRAVLQQAMAAASI